MNVDKHILFLIVIIGIISAGIVGATVINHDNSTKEEVFDGMTVTVPANSEFVKVDDGKYQDNVNEITIRTFKNNDSMIDYLKNTKKSKIIPVDNQPPQSVAFKKGDKISILVTNGEEGLSVTSKDGDLTSQIANSIIFSNHHKSEKPQGFGVVKQPMTVEQDFNLIAILIADVDTTIFNTAIFNENAIILVDDYNAEIGADVDDESGDYVSDIEDEEDLEDVLTDSAEAEPADDEASETHESDESPAATATVSDEASQAQPSHDDEPDDTATPDTAAPDTAANDNSEPEPYSADECAEIVEEDIVQNIDLGPEYSIDHRYDEEMDGYYVFFIQDPENEIVANYTVDPTSGQFYYFDMRQPDALF